jgi:hypothetical protein
MRTDDGTEQPQTAAQAGVDGPPTGRSDVGARVAS